MKMTLKAAAAVINTFGYYFIIRENNNNNNNNQVFLHICMIVLVCACVFVRMGDLSFLLSTPSRAVKVYGKRLFCVLLSFLPFLSFFPFFLFFMLLGTC